LANFDVATILDEDDQIAFEFRMGIMFDWD